MGCIYALRPFSCYRPLRRLLLLSDPSILERRFELVRLATVSDSSDEVLAAKAPLAADACCGDFALAS